MGEQRRREPNKKCGRQAMIVEAAPDDRLRAEAEIDARLTGVE